MKLDKIILKNVEVCNPDGVSQNQVIGIDGDKFRSLNSAKTEIDLKGYTIYPGLINGHDHLLGTWLPRVGNGPYLNWKPWDDDLKASALYQERGKISNEEIYQLSYFRQILSGVTTVSDHIPHIVNKEFIKSSYIRVIEDYALAHEVSSYDLKWGDELLKEIEFSKEKNIPFITHIEEGFDDEALVGIPNLQKNNGLFENSVLIHCVSCDEDDIDLISKQKSSMVWCPTSNIYMFNKTAKIKSFLEKNVNVVLGTDSPMSGGVNLLAEMKYARNTYQDLYKEDLSFQSIFSMVTKNAARAFKLEKSLGKIEDGFLADFVVLSSKTKDAYENIVNAEMSDFELIFKDGYPILGKEKFKYLIKGFEERFETIKINSEKYFIIGKPLQLLNDFERKLGFRKEFSFLPISK